MLFKKIDETSSSSVTSALSFFETPDTSVGISNSNYVEILTLNPVSEFPLHFKIVPGSNFLDLSHVFLETEMKIQKALKGTHNWGPIDASDSMSTIQAVGACWINQVKITMNGRETFNSNRLYAYKSYLDTELSYSRSQKENYLQSIGYYPQGPQEYDQNDLSNSGLKARHELFKEGKPVQFFTRLNADIFTSDLYLINAVPIEIELYQNHSDFLLMRYVPKGKTDEETATIKTASDLHYAQYDYRLTITACKLFYKSVSVMDGVALDVQNSLEKTPARYGLRRSALSNFQIPGGLFEYQHTLFTDQVPRRVLIAFVDPDAFNGSMEKSPFVFGHNNIKDIHVSVGGQTTPAVLYNLDFEGNGMRFMRAYYDMMSSISMTNAIDNNGISPNHFKNGWCFLMFNMTSDLENNEAFELVKQGTTSFTVRFGGTGVPSKGLQVIVYGEFDSLLLLDKNRTISSDLTIGM